MALIEKFIIEVDSKLIDLFEKEEEFKAADAILHIFKRRENLNIFNKKMLFLYVKEITDVESNTITKVIKKLKIIYTDLLENEIKNVDQDIYS